MNDIYSPLQAPMFRNAWASSVLTNLGLLIQGVGVAWVMVEVASRDAMVAWVQAATSLPLMLMSIPAGAVADVFNRRKVALLGLLVALSGACALIAASVLGRITPAVLLSLCFLAGSGFAFYDPAWQASVPSLVSREQLPHAIALRSMSQNLARAVGPAIGGVLVAWKGGGAAFICVALFYLPLIVVLYRWPYRQAVPRLPPERIAEAVRAGLRFVRHSPSVRIVVLRGFMAGTLGVGLLALMPLAAKYRLHGGAIQYGIMLGTFGVGAVSGAAGMSRLRQWFSRERVVSMSMVAMGLGAVSMAVLSNLAAMAPFLVLAGMGWLVTFSNLNISVQLIAPRWVMGRALASYAAASTGGMVLGSFVWGELLHLVGIEQALLILGACNIAAWFLGAWLRLPDRDVASEEASNVAESISLALPINLRSGPITIDHEYRVDPTKARAFYRLMQMLERQRKRNGAYSWSLSRDLKDDWLWIERYHLSTWVDYLRLKSRSTERDIETLSQVHALQHPGAGIATRLRLERPMGSVRWADDVIDSGISRTPYLGNN